MLIERIGMDRTAPEERQVPLGLNAPVRSSGGGMYLPGNGDKYAAPPALKEA